MAAEAHVVINGPSRLLERAQRRLERLEARWFAEHGEVSRITRDAGTSVAVSAETAMLVDLAGGARVDRAARTVTVPVGLVFDPSSIAKGLAADFVSGELLTLGAAGALVSIGGAIRVM